MTSAAKIITNLLLQKIKVLANYGCKNYKKSLNKAKFLLMFSSKQGQASGSNIAKKMFWWDPFL